MKEVVNKLEWKERFSKILKKYFYTADVEKGFFLINSDKKMWNYSYNGKNLGSASELAEAKQKCEEYNKAGSQKPKKNE